MIFNNLKIASTTSYDVSVVGKLCSPTGAGSSWGQRRGLAAEGQPSPGPCAADGRPRHLPEPPPGSLWLLCPSRPPAAPENSTKDQGPRGHRRAWPRLSSPWGPCIGVWSLVWPHLPGEARSPPRDRALHPQGPPDTRAHQPPGPARGHDHRPGSWEPRSGGEWGGGAEAPGRPRRPAAPAQRTTPSGSPWWVCPGAPGTVRNRTGRERARR